jgi:oligopeptide/dipeptide ABC transporter ATP-binding protein
MVDNYMNMIEKDELNSRLLSVRDLRVKFEVKGSGTLRAVDGVDLEIDEGEVLGLVGESGCGKTVLSLSLLRLIAPPGKINSGEILWKEKDLLKLNHKDMLKIRGKEMAMIFQNPESSLNPVYTVGTQLISVIRLHHELSKEDARKEALRLLHLVKISDPERIMDNYPHQLSGGMCQRIMIAIALSCRPKLLIADEPTASLDVTIQAQIMDLLLELRDAFGMAILFVSHDLGVIARMCDRIAVMYLGRIVEYAVATDLYESPKHPYTQALLKSVPAPDPNQRGKIARIEGDVPSPVNIPSGCRFRSRCPMVFELCPNIDPVLYRINNNGHFAACLLYKK